MNKLSDFWFYVDSMTSKNLNACKIARWLNKDKLAGIYVDSETKRYYLETTMFGDVIPKNVRVYIKKWAKAQGYTYLYENN